MDWASTSGNVHSSREIHLGFEQVMTQVEVGGAAAGDEPVRRLRRFVSAPRRHSSFSWKETEAASSARSSGLLADLLWVMTKQSIQTRLVFPGACTNYLTFSACYSGPLSQALTGILWL